MNRNVSHQSKAVWWKLITRHKMLVPIACGVLATGAIFASAASLGTVNTQTLGTSTQIIQSCQNATFTTGWPSPTYSGTGGVAGTPTYLQTQITLSNIQATCYAKAYSLTVAKTDGTSLGVTSGTLPPASTANLTLTPSVDSALAAKVTLTIYG